MKIGNAEVIDWHEGIELLPGFFYTNVPNHIYHKSMGDSNSKLSLFNEDPYKYFNYKEKEQTRPMQLGSAIHAACLEPELFDVFYMLLPEVKDRRQPEYKQAVKSFGVGNVFAANEVEKIKGMQQAIHQNEQAHEYLSANGWSELTLVFIDPESGLLMRCKFDKLAIINGRYVAIDLKKTTSIEERKLSMSIFTYRYHVQAALYKRAFKIVTGIDIEFVFIFVEEDYPHMVDIRELCDLSNKIGLDQAMLDMTMLAKYKTQELTAHNNRKCSIISLPEFVMRQHEQEVI